MKPSLSLFLMAGLLFSGCSRTVSHSGGRIPDLKGPPKDALRIPLNSSKIVSLPNGADIVVRDIGGKPMITVEATFANDWLNSFERTIALWPDDQREAAMNKEISDAFSAMASAKAQVMPGASYPEVGYFTFLLEYEEDLLGAIKRAEFKQPILFSPVAVDMNSFANQDPSGSPRTETKGFSGLERIGVSEFLLTAEADIGNRVKIDGSTVRLGITDTGITFHHPTFLGADGSPRIKHMRDFTAESRVYFNYEAAFKATRPNDGKLEDLIINAEVIPTPRLPSRPAGDDLIAIEGLKIKTSAELAALLTAENTRAKLGVLLESSFQGPGDDVDINGNGRLNDKLFVFLIPGETLADDRIYIDVSGTGDFRTAKALGDWNRTGDTVEAFSERFGFDLRREKLPTKNGNGPVEVFSASIVGFDPGGHGTHVAGIAAGKKTILNDSDDSLARGVAPAATILMNRVCANNAGCNATEAFIDLLVNAKADVVNMSLGALNPFNDGYGVQETLINRLTQKRNALFVISASNAGPGRQTVGSPSTARLALSVGASASKEMIQRQYEWPGFGTGPDASDDQDFMLFFSSRGPTAAGGFKPNISAPGTELSSVPLNAAPGGRAGLDVLWGTSMAAPTATGAYALLLDAIRKYNAAHPDAQLSTTSATLSAVIQETARPFDVNRFDPESGYRSRGQYTWIDQGFGMIDLVAAWKKMFEVRDTSVASPVTLAGRPVDLDFSVFVSAKNPNGIAYDGSRAGAKGTPAFAAGIYLSYTGTETLRPVFVSRRLPAQFASGPLGGAINRLLVSTRDEFVLKTVFYGSDMRWLEAGVLDSVNCAESDTANLTILGRGAEIELSPDGTGYVNDLKASNLNVCIDRAMIANKLPPGDHGAIIRAYRTVNGILAPLPSFIVPVYLTIPHKTLANSTGYDVTSSVKSFGLNRNYVSIPAGTSLAKVTLAVPAIKVDSNGLASPGEICSGVELMALTGNNVTTPIKPRSKARIANCASLGTPESNPAKRQLSFTVNGPAAGMWDLHVFGSHKFPISKFNLKVDYLTAETSVSKIEGRLSALNGSLNWRLKETSMIAAPDATKSTFELTALRSSVRSEVARGERVLVSSPLGRMRVYPDKTRSVTITTGGSPGNDIDLILLECSTAAESEADDSCQVARSSDNSSDEESVTFAPKADKAYMVRVHGHRTKNDVAAFTSTETITVSSEAGLIEIVATNLLGEFAVSHSFESLPLKQSFLLNSTLFDAGGFSVVGELLLRTVDGTLLTALPVNIIGR